jgi:hypothetical protein
MTPALLMREDVAYPAIGLPQICRLAWIDNGREGYGGWRPIADDPRLSRIAAELQTDNPGVRAWVERR